MDQYDPQAETGASNNDPLKPGRVTQGDIAQALGINRSTVSRALRDDPRIPENRRREIQATAAQMGYQTNAVAVALSQHRKASHLPPTQATLAWMNLWPNPKELYEWREFERYHQGAVEEARLNGYRLDEFSIAGGLPMARLQRILEARGIRGILLPPAGHYRPEDWASFDWRGFCVVRFGHSVREPKFHLVSSDQVTDGIIAYNRIWDLGYRRIGLVRSHYAHTRFVAGASFQRQLVGDTFDAPPLILHFDDLDQDRERMRTWMDDYRPDAVFTGVPSTAELLQDLGYRIPEDVGLAAFSILDGKASAGIDQNPVEIGQAAVQMLISLMHHHQQGIPKSCRELLVEGWWQDGSSLPPKTT